MEVKLRQDIVHHGTARYNCHHRKKKRCIRFPPFNRFVTLGILYGAYSFLLVVVVVVYLLLCFTFLPCLPVLLFPFGPFCFAFVRSIEIQVAFHPSPFTDPAARCTTPTFQSPLLRPIACLARSRECFVICLASPSRLFPCQPGLALPMPRHFSRRSPRRIPVFPFLPLPSPCFSPTALPSCLSLGEHPIITCPLCTTTQLGNSRGPELQIFIILQPSFFKWHDSQTHPYRPSRVVVPYSFLLYFPLFFR